MLIWEGNYITSLKHLFGMHMRIGEMNFLKFPIKMEGHLDKKERQKRL
jgi:hypothetical protein